MVEYATVVAFCQSRPSSLRDMCISASDSRSTVPRNFWAAERLEGRVGRNVSEERVDITLGELGGLESSTSMTLSPTLRIKCHVGSNMRCHCSSYDMTSSMSLLWNRYLTFVTPDPPTTDSILVIAVASLS